MWLELFDSVTEKKGGNILMSLKVKNIVITQ